MKPPDRNASLRTHARNSIERGLVCGFVSSVLLGLPMSDPLWVCDSRSFGCDSRSFGCLPPIVFTSAWSGALSGSGSVERPPVQQKAATDGDKSTTKWLSRLGCSVLSTSRTTAVTSTLMWGLRLPDGNALVSRVARATRLQQAVACLGHNICCTYLASGGFFFRDKWSCAVETAAAAAVAAAMQRQEHATGEEATPKQKTTAPKATSTIYNRNNVSSDNNIRIGSPRRGRHIGDLNPRFLSSIAQVTTLGGVLGGVAADHLSTAFSK